MSRDPTKGRLSGPLILSLGALIFGAFGLLYVVMPVQMASSVGIELKTPGAIIDAQGLYGGLEIGLACFLGFCALKLERRRLGLLAGTLALGAIATTRLLAVARVGLPDPTVAALIGLDAFGAALNFYGYRRSPPS